MNIFELILALSGFFGGLGVPLGMPPAEFNQFVARFAPEKCLVFVGWSGVEDPVAERNPTETWLSQPGVRQASARFYEAIRNRRSPQLHHSWPDNRRLAVECLKQVTAAAMRQPTAVCVTELKMDRIAVKKLEASVMVVLEKKMPEIKQVFQRWKAAVDRLPQRSKNRFRVIETGTFAGPAIQIRLSARYSLCILITDDLALVTSSEASMKQGLKNLQSPAPGWLNEMQARWPVERVASVSYISISGTLNELIRNYGGGFGAASLGSWPNKIGAITNVSGLDRHGYVSHTELEIADDDWDLLRIIPGEAIPREALEQLDSREFLGVALRLDASAALELVQRVAKDSGFQRSLDDALDEIERFTGVKVQEQVLDDFGDLVTLSVGMKAETKDADRSIPKVYWRGTIAIDEPVAFPGTLERLYQSVVASVKRLNLPIQTDSYRRNGFPHYVFSSRDIGFGIGVWSGWTFNGEQLFVAGGMDQVEFETRQQVPFLRRDSQQMEMAEFFQLADRPGIFGPIAVMRVNWKNLLQVSAALRKVVAARLAAELGPIVPYENLGTMIKDGPLNQKSVDIYGVILPVEQVLNLPSPIRLAFEGPANLLRIGTIFGSLAARYQARAEQVDLVTLTDWKLPAIVGIQAQNLPPIEEWFVGVRPSYSAMYRTDRGYYIRHRQTLPTSSPMAAALAGIVLAAPDSLADYLK